MRTGDVAGYPAVLAGTYLGLTAVLALQRRRKHARADVHHANLSTGRDNSAAWRFQIFSSLAQ